MWKGSAYLLACLITCMSYWWFRYTLTLFLVVSIWFGADKHSLKKNKDKTSRTHVMGGSPSSHREFPSISSHQLKSAYFARSKSVHPVTYSKHRGNVYSKLWQQHVMRFKDWEAMPYPRWAIACYRYQLQLELGEMPFRWNWLQFPTRILLISWSFLWVIPWLYSGLVQVDYEELMEGTFSPSVAEEIRKRGTLAAIFLLVRVSWICFWHTTVCYL